MSQIVINGNNIDILKKYPDNYFDAVVTDPPYGLGKEPNAAELMKDWVEHGYHEVSGSGFMGKEWDAFVPQPVFWKEVFRVLKHGGHVLSFFGTRTYDWGVMSMRFAGFEVRDCIQWLYGSGFPKSYNIAKGIEGKIVNGSSSWNDWKKLDGEKEQVNWGYSKGQAEQGYREDYTEANKERVGKVNYKSEDAKKWDGWGSALKPANEPIVLARKPLEKGLSIAENILKWGVGGINIDASRIGNVGGTIKTNTEDCFDNNIYGDGLNGGTKTFVDGLGRFPANIILTHHPDCECIGTKKAGKGERKQHQDGEVSSANEGYTRPNKNMHTHKDSSVIANYGEETIEDWDCHEDCPIRILDEQSGISKSNPRTTCERRTNSTHEYGFKSDAYSPHSDTGGASRFFYVAKASKAERNKGLEGFDTKQTIGGGGTYNEEAGAKYGSIKAEGKNFHPTVKPIKLMQYLIKMITPPNGIVLDPFCGSGTTGVACKLEGFQFVGMEQDPDYSKIAEGRIKNYKEEKEKTPKNKPKEDKQPINTQTTLF
jgi:site-specific DNA-methyltransferase (adenine-specific)